MLTELEFLLCVMAEREQERWLIPKQPGAKPHHYYQLYLPLKDALSHLTFHAVKAKLKVVVLLEDKADFAEVRKIVNSMLSNPPENLIKLMKKALQFKKQSIKLKKRPIELRKHSLQLKKQ